MEVGWPQTACVTKVELAALISSASITGMHRAVLEINPRASFVWQLAWLSYILILRNDLFETLIGTCSWGISLHSAPALPPMHTTSALALSAFGCHSRLRGFISIRQIWLCLLGQWPHKYCFYSFPVFPMNLPDWGKYEKLGSVSKFSARQQNSGHIGVT